jgi:hypothetical protein
MSNEQAVVAKTNTKILQEDPDLQVGKESSQAFEAKLPSATTCSERHGDASSKRPNPHLNQSLENQDSIVIV